MLTENWDYKHLDQKGHTIVEYVWIGGLGDDLRSKARTIKGEVKSVDDLPIWNYDGSSTFQAQTESSEVEIVPVALFDDPFRGAPNKIALCETRHSKEKPTLSNFRRFAREAFTEKNIEEHDPWFGIEQEYILTKRIGSQIDWPIGWTPGEFPGPQGMYYCGEGAKYVYGREISDSHYKACLYAGVKIYGTNAEVFPGQWEFQVGNCSNIEIGDHLWMARFLIKRVAEKFGIDVTFEPKPYQGWNGSGAHLNYSTKGTREDVDMKCINKHLESIAQYHTKSIAVYGENNHLRLTGKYETSSMDKFSSGVMDRAASLRIPQSTKDNGKGYYEDRRPAANVNPYIASTMLFSITCLGGAYTDELIKQYQEFLAHKKGDKVH